MNFAEKLIFLMRVTHVSNKELASFLGIDPSRISQMRSGRRGIPRDKQLLHSMSLFFALHTQSESQCLALYEATGQIRLKYPMDHAVKGDLLFHWLSGDPLPDPARAPSFVSVPDGAEEDAALPLQQLLPNAAMRCYYGNAGKREAVEQFYRMVAAQPSVDQIYMVTDESENWYAEDPDFLKRIKHYRRALVRKGIPLLQIQRPWGSPGEAYESVIRWLPFYINGCVYPYYYPRIRDGLFRQTCFCVPGKLCLFSCSTGASAGSPFTILSADPDFTRAITRNMEDYLALCKTAMIPRRSEEEIRQYLRIFLTRDGDLASISPTLSIVSLPASMLEKTSLSKDFSKNLLQTSAPDPGGAAGIPAASEYLDLCRLASPEEVRRGEVPLPFPASGMNSSRFYTKEEYCSHLRHILQLMDACPNYYFIPLPQDFPRPGLMAVRGSQFAFLVHSARPSVLYEVVQPLMATIFQEYLHRLAEKETYQSNYSRLRVKSRIRSLIEALES